MIDDIEGDSHERYWASHLFASPSGDPSRRGAGAGHEEGDSIRRMRGHEIPTM